MSERIKRFLESEPISYDFTNDCTRDEKYKAKKGHDKYFAYKIEKNVGDPDSASRLLQEIYKLLWPELLDKEYMRGARGNISSDTMTSVHYTMETNFDEKLKEEVVKYKAENPRQRHISVRMCKNMYEQYENVRNELDNYENFEHFVSVYHTIGNYSPVPSLFNGARSGPGVSPSYDYWDLTLMKIKEYYDLREKKDVRLNEDVLPITQLFHCTGNICNCLQWLNDFSSWGNFIEQNYFQDYVDENGEVIPFCKGHSWKNGCNEVIDYNEFFENAWKRIEARSQRIINAINETLSSQSTSDR